MENTNRPWRVGQNNFYNDKLWLKTRAKFLSRNKVCNFCGGKATVVDHIKPHRGNYALFINERNWQPLCKLCHDSAKQKAERRGLDHIGVDENGFPIDPSHLWNQK